MRPGWGERHPDLARLLAESQPEAMVETAWANGTVPLRISAYASPAPLPDELIVSIRCIVRVEDLFVVCTNAENNSHPWPGGRREQGETHLATASREVLEETGWIIRSETFRPLGWLHLEDLTNRDSGWPYPHPDFLQAVYAVEAVDRACGTHGEWTDSEGYELSSRLMPPPDALNIIDPVARVFLELLL